MMIKSQDDHPVTSLSEVDPEDYLGGVTVFGIA